MHEEQACAFLIDRGFEIIERNFHSRFGEIDIIAMRDGVLHIVEVKGGRGFDPIYAITPKKIQKIIQTLQYYLMINRLEIPYCIDGISICDDEIEWIENMTCWE
ncbi:YraN family protein [Helicobacter pametensis]|uniref:YraN family protein n=1 Tax=Helicobacter pametensis TaxID=95149 RepID=UPI0004AD4A15